MNAIKFVSFTRLSSPTIDRVGVRLNVPWSASPRDGNVIDLSHATFKDTIPRKCASDMVEFIAAGPSVVQSVRDILKSYSSIHQAGFGEEIVPGADLQLLSPIPTPRRNVMCIGKNYIDHIAEVAAAQKTANLNSGAQVITPDNLPKHPVFFSKAPSSVVGPEADVESHSKLTKLLDYEAELAVVIGKKGRDIPAVKVSEYIFGYTVSNDITARDLQSKHTQWFKGKSLDTSCPLGPHIVLADDLAQHKSGVNSLDLAVKLWIDGEKRQDSRTSNMIFKIPDIVSELSAGMTLYPGDIILTGTPDGVGYAMKPEPKVLRAGQRMRIEIEDVGVLENTVVV